MQHFACLLIANMFTLKNSSSNNRHQMLPCYCLPSTEAAQLPAPYQADQHQCRRQ
jgi:hypothetical protein